ncbi:MAG: hypothetical protein L3J20_01090 [Flavobacteriaceae bacterium]|nr:hypothetical protein [Flavobacteriaceae bacterium]
MKNISNWVLSLSAEKITKLLIVFPIGILLVLISVSFIIRMEVLPQNSIVTAIVEFLSIKGILLLLFLVILFWTSWIWATVISSKEEIIGLKLKWFRYSFYIFLIFIIWQIIWIILTKSGYKLFGDESEILPIYNEITGIITGLGLFIGYPVICHYAARVLFFKKTKKKTTFINTLGYSLLLIFIPISIPFLHLYIHEGKSETSSIIKLYGIAVFLLFVLFCISLIAAFSGVI